jgi:DNA replication protein DnaC
MNNPNISIKQLCLSLNLTSLSQDYEQIMQQAEQGQVGYRELASMLLEYELEKREEKKLSKRLKEAGLPISHDLALYDFNYNNGIKPAQLNQLKELAWLDQNYNMVIMGPTGTGKTFLAAGLCYHAILSGYKAYFRPIEQIMDMLRLKEVANTAKADYKRLLGAHLIVVDDIMLMPVSKPDAAKLFGFINMLFEKTSFIITTNKSPQQWVEMLDDEVLATALLDRLLFKCQVIPLEGKSYRLINRKSIFNDENL